LLITRGNTHTTAAAIAALLQMLGLQPVQNAVPTQSEQGKGNEGRRRKRGEGEGISVAAPNTLMVLSPPM